MLKGDKVILRPHRREDVALVWQFRTDVEVELAGGGDPPRPIPLHQVEQEFEKQEFVFDTQGSFAIEASEDARYIGFCGLFHFDDLARTCELGITIGDKAYWGRGYGRDTIRLLLDYAFRIRNVRRVWLHTHSTNERAIRCYRACGFVEEGRLRQHLWCNGAYADQVWMGVLREEWDGARVR